MNCSDFERLINERLDARGDAPDEAGRALEAHGEDCPSCRAIALRYRTLIRAIDAMKPPTPPADLAGRVADALVREASGTSSLRLAFGRAVRSWPAALPLAAAAALLMAAWLGMHSGGRPAGHAPPVGVASAPTPSRPVAPDPLSDALAQATAATLDLARSASAPAARVGLEIFDADALADLGDAVASPSGGDRPVADPGTKPGGRGGEPSRPLAGTALHAFDFLLGPAPPRGPRHGSADGA
jgi:predicted anti-sigma-YlaC factor YlaD